MCWCLEAENQGSCPCGFKLTHPITQVDAILICHTHLHILVLGSSAPPCSWEQRGQGGKRASTLTPDPCYQMSVVSPQGGGICQAGQGRSWAGGRGLILALKQQRRHQHEHGSTSPWEAAFISHSALDAGSSFWREETWVGTSQAEGNHALGRSTNLRFLCPDMTTTPLQAPSGLWPSVLAESQPSTSLCQHYPPTCCAKAQDQSSSLKPKQLPSPSAKYLAPLPGL